MSNRSGYRCAFKDCTSVSGKSDGSKKTLFGFPKDAERCKLWIAACNREDLAAKDPITLHYNYRICKDHFADTMFLNFEKTRLQPHAVPFSILDNIDYSMHNKINMGASTNSANIDIPILEDHLSNAEQENFSESHYMERTKHKQKDINIQTSLSLSTIPDSTKRPQDHPEYVQDGSGYL